jgi:hypothetical protein
MQKFIWVLWPSFAVAGVAEIFLFSAVDPVDLHFLGETLATSRLGAYSVGFFVLWGICAASSMTTCFFQRTSAAINRAHSRTKLSLERGPRMDEPSRSA